MKNFIKQNRVRILLFLIIILTLYFVLEFKSSDKEGVKTNPSVTQDSDLPLNSLSNDEIMTKLDDILDVLLRIHYISLNETENDLTNPIASQLQEGLKDVNALNKLLYKTDELAKSQNKFIDTTGLVIGVTIKSLLITYNNWITYLRGINVNTVDVSEFQYQLTLFHTSANDAYLTMAENVQLLPMVAVAFSKDENGVNGINEEIKKHFLEKIDSLFNHILIEDDRYHKETKLRYVVPVIINSYKEFFITKSI